jgi:hypothetical protein
VCEEHQPHTSPSSIDDYTCHFLGVCGKDVYTPHSPFLPSFLLTLNKERRDRQATHLRFFDKFSTSSRAITLHRLELFAK